MASFPASKSAAKQLKEHLQEQQEPFTLNIYLFERGYSAKSLSSKGRNGCCQINLFKNLRRSHSYSFNKKMALLSTRVVKSILYKLVSANDNDCQELSCCSNKANLDEFQTEVKGLITPFGGPPSCNGEEGSLPSKYQPAAGSLCTTSQASNLGNVEPKKILTNKTCQRKCTLDKHLDLMSTLNKLSSDKVHQILTRQESSSSRNSTNLIENAKGNFVFATFPWKLLGKSLMERYTLIGFKEAKGQSRRNQELGNQWKPLFNLPEKSIKSNETNARNKYNYIHCFIILKKLGNLTRADQQVYTCKRDSGDSSMGFSDPFETGNYSKLQKTIGIELGDTIMDAIVEEVIDLLRL